MKRGTAMSIDPIELQIVFYRNVLHQNIQAIAQKTGMPEQRIINILRKIRTRSERLILPDYYCLTYSNGMRKRVYHWSNKYEMCRDMFEKELKKILEVIAE